MGSEPRKSREPAVTAGRDLASSANLLSARESARAADKFRELGVSGGSGPDKSRELAPTASRDLASSANREVASPRESARTADKSPELVTSGGSGLHKSPGIVVPGAPELPRPPDLARRPPAETQVPRHSGSLALL